MKLLDFLLNRTDDGSQSVEAPAFALTKVLSSAAVIVTPLATLIVEKTSSIDLTSGEYVTLAIALLGFLAVTSSADVLARSIAAAGRSKTDAGQQNAKAHAVAAGRLIPFDAPLAGRRMNADGSGHTDVQVLAAAQSDGPLFLVKEADAPLGWAKASEVKIP